MIFRILTLFVFLAPGFLSAQTSTFDTGNEGWLASGDPSSPNPAWTPSGGNPGGFIQVTDASIGGTWYFEAGSQYDGNKCDAYGKLLRWDQFTSDTSSQQAFGGNPDVVLEGGSLTLVFDNAQNPGLTWTHYEILLREDAGWRLGNINGPVPTAQQFQSVLANLSGLRIRGEYRAQADFGGLDNFILESTFNFDLDVDDSSGETHGGFNADTTCTPTVPVADLDVALFSEKRIDSIVLRVLFAQNPAFEIFTVALLPPGIAAQQPAPGRLTLVNTGGATPIDFLIALQTVQYADLSPNPARQVRIASVRVYTTCGDMGQRYAYLPVFPPANAGADAAVTLCAGDPPLDLIPALGSTAESGGFWQPAPAGGGSLFDPARDAPGAYRYIIPDAGPCPGDTATLTVQVEEPFRLRADTMVCYGDTLELTIPPNLTDWRWSDGSRRAALPVTAPGVYTLSGQTAQCLFTDSIRVDFITCTPCAFYAPNVFSPNDDGENDRWQIFLPCAWQRFRLEVFDRWGNQVFASDNPDRAWDGYWRGREAPAGVYGWRLEWEGELLGKRQVFREGGDVTVLR